MSDIRHHFAQVNGMRLHYLTAGDPLQEPLVLLAGFPQSSFAWREIMPLLTERFYLIAPDLPGQGDSDLPLNGFDTATLAQQTEALLRQLNVSAFNLVGHDIGAWVAFALAAQFPERVKKVALLDAGIPGVTMPDALPTASGNVWKTWHFAFHLVADLPESLIAGREAIYLDWFLRRKAANPRVFDTLKMQEYLRIFTRPGALRAGLAFYRAFELSASQNRAVVQNGRLPMPLLAVSADQGSIPDMATPLRQFFTSVSGVTLDACGHFIPEEQPAALAKHFYAFFCRCCRQTEARVPAE
ncbi:alpha/beta fold hydrolase [Pantoea sp. KPR_PJ]|uniref:alpha/beta fold hydrolase n=1 Tax=Pantoea sp. KPR_PJ TaxID=2738375 RepID=UPI00352800B6